MQDGGCLIKNSVAIILLSFLLLVLSIPVYADYIDADASIYAINGTNVTVRGYISMDNTSGVNMTNVTGLLGSSNFSILTNTSRNWSTGFFEFNLTSSNTTGRYNVTINATLSNGTVVTENIEIRVGSIGNATFNFTNKRPPFNNGSYFELNVSFTGTASTAPKLAIFAANSANSSGWAINNLTTRINTNRISYNITIPADADGRYVIMFDEGAGATIFLVKSTVVVVANTEDSTNATAASYGLGEGINIIGKVRDENNAIVNANVTAFITLPNGTLLNISLRHNGTGVDGSYNGTFTNTNAPGDYTIEIVANVSGRIVKSTSIATIQRLEGELDIVSDFFFDFGSSSAFQAGGQIGFNVLVSNLSSDIILNGSTTAAASTVFCNNITVVQLKNSLNGSVLSSPVITKSTGLFVGQTVCKINFTAPSVDGIYSLSINASVGTDSTNTVPATGYFSVQSYIMSPQPVSSIGGGHEFLSFLMPGDNATFEISVRNLSARGGAVTGNLITNFNVTKITPMEFVGGGQSEITNVQVLEYTNGTASANPKIKLKIPENKTGPFIIEFQATAAGSVILGNSFYFARYVEGFTFPASFGGGFGHGDEGGGEFSSGPSAGGSFRCRGAQNFTAQIFDVRTRQAARNIVFNSIQEAREEHTGRSVKNSLSIVSSASTDSNGIGNMTINFSGSFSGFYFMLINITTSDGKSDSLPGGFECRQLSFFPQITAIGSTGSGGFFVAPTSGLNVSVSGIKNLNTGNSTVNGTVSIAKLESFDPVKGHKALPGLTAAYNIVNGAAAFTVFPSNFSGLGGKWFNGFNDLRIQVCDNNNNTNPADDICDTAFGGFMVVAFDAFLDFSAPQSSTLNTNTSAVYRIMARTNVTNFTVQIGLPWEGSVQDANVTNWTLISDGWNSANDSLSFSGFERWDINFTTPTSLRKGGNMIIIKVNNYLGETTEVMTFATASSLSIKIPDTEGIFMTNFSVEGNASNATQVNNFITSFKTSLSALNLTFNGTYSKSGTVCARINFTTTRFGPSSTDVIYNGSSNTNVFLIDNSSTGNYDVLVVNNSGRIAVATSANRSLASAGFSNLYFIKSDGCGFASIVNSNLNGTGFGAGYGGQHPINSIARIPFIVKVGNAVKSNVIINVSQMVAQQDFGGGRGGFGFTDFLPSSNFTSTAATTDANGVAFLQINVSKSGFYSMIWNFNDSGTVDTADFSESIPIEIKGFDTETGILSFFSPRVVTLTRNATNTRSATIGNSPIFVTSWNEATQGQFMDDTSTSTIFIALRNVTENPPGTKVAISGGQFTDIIIDDDEDLGTNSTDTGVFTPIYANWTDRFAVSGSTPMSVDGNRSTDENTTKLVFGTPYMSFGTFIQNTGSSSRIEANVTIRVCGYTFSQPRTPLIGANVSRLTTQSFSFSGPPETTNLTAYDPFTNAVTESVVTGPSGCATFNVTRADPGQTRGWRAGFTNEIKARITSGGITEDLFVGSISVACPSSGSCF